MHEMVRDFKHMLEKELRAGFWGHAALLLLACSSAGASEHRLLLELRNVRAEPGWKVARAEEPNVFLLVHGRLEESFAAIQVRSLGRSDVREVKARLESLSLRSDDHIGVWAVESVSAEGGCYDLTLKGGPAEDEVARIHQLWCFNPRFALILIESGRHRISASLRMELRSAMKRSLLQRD
jgi:hypothetical protein